MQRRRSLVALVALAALGTGHVAMAAMPHTTILAATMQSLTGATIDPAQAMPATTPAAATPGATPAATIADDSIDGIVLDRGAPDAPEPAAIADTPAVRSRDVECMAKVIVHEAGNQPYRGQMAVAQVIRARIRAGFADTACAVVKQPGQFFDVDAYQPARTGRRWNTAVEIATDTLQGEGDEVVPGALFFHSAGASMPTRTRVAQIADHTFYR